MITILIVYVLGAFVWFIVNVMNWLFARDNLFGEDHNQKMHARRVFMTPIWFLVFIYLLAKDAFFLPKEKS